MRIEMPSDASGSGSAAGARTGLLWQVVSTAAKVTSSRHGELRVLDCGGGSGTFAVLLARSGAAVTVVDISADALATLGRRAAESGVGDLVQPVQGDIESLAEAIGAETFDLVLAHGVLGVVDDLPATFGSIAAAVKPLGLLSVLTENPVAVVLARALAGDVATALAALRGLTTDFTQVGPGAVRQLCQLNGLILEQVHGVGVFNDFVPGRALDLPGAREVLAELEAESSTLSPFAEIATRVHLLARRPAN